ncbi:GmrSD restriction endonuclease domain-containing protein [Candidatus Poriferisodalis sp.]|uniref:GmrSD restriction endonuclease domain-containing protein n=1 Tax=Candidatus Poriferisodalis sp. TaxID=3101277 RepID=UPI003B5160E5
MRHPNRFRAAAGRIAAAAVLLAAAGCATTVDTTAPTAPAAEDTAPAAPEPTQPSDTTPATTQARTRDTAPATTAAGGEPQAQAEESEEPDGSAVPADNGTQADENGAADVSEAEDEKTDEPEADSEDEDTGAQDETEAGVRPEADTTPRTKIDEYRRLFDALTVAPEIAGGYGRSLFKHWTDADKDGCDTRKEVLLAEAIRAPQIGTRCALSGGEWLSRYDGKTTDGTGSGFDVDHLVPLQEAWQSGARDWEPALREHFANFLDYRDALVAVSASSNRSKGARDPAEWLPPSAGVHCWYAAAWVNVKSIFDLNVDRAEVDSLDGILAGCEDDDLTTWPQAQADPDDDSGDEKDTESSAEDTQTEEAAPEIEPKQDNDCHPAYEPCLPNLPGDAINCGDLSADQKPVTVKEIGVDPYRLDRDNDGRGCTS